jgi:hypothetical protein
MEGFLNYYYWQALATNPFDSIGHILRVSATLDLGGCSGYFTTIDAKNHHCNRWLGPYQPGVNAPDPTEIPGEEGEGDGQAPAGAAARATAAAGSSPQPAPPPTPPLASGPQPPAAGDDTEVLLDYLLAP